MPEKYLKKLQKDFDDVIEYLKSQLVKIRAGRASASLVEDLRADYYGQATPLKSLASISTPAPREIQLDVWDDKAVKPIVDVLSQASLGSQPQSDGKVIHISLPPITGETREKLSEKVHSLTEETKVSLRNAREKVWDEIQELEKEGNVREDEKFRLRDKIQKLIDEYNEKVDATGEKKQSMINQ